MPTIAETMQRLDPSNDDHWTADGLPALEALRQLGGGVSVTRKQVNETAPGFNRIKAEEALKAAQAEQRRALATNAPAPGLTTAPDMESENIEGGGPAAQASTVAASQPQKPSAPQPAPVVQPAQVEASSEPAAPTGAITAEAIDAGVQQLIREADGVSSDPVRAAEAAVLRAQQIADASRAMVVKLQAEYEARAREAEAARPANHTHAEISRYHETQTRLREQRAERVRAFNEAGLKDVLKNMGPSKLDAAFSKRPNQADARPALRVPAMAGQTTGDGS